MAVTGPTKVATWGDTRGADSPAQLPLQVAPGGPAPGQSRASLGEDRFSGQVIHGPGWH